jgi:hypothetical protein
MKEKAYVEVEEQNLVANGNHPDLILSYMRTYRKKLNR